jgi:hypothetical protein
MCCMMTRIAVALGTFIVGIVLASMWFSNRQLERSHGTLVLNHEIPSDPTRVEIRGEDAPLCESPDQDPVLIAEEFIARNGYTDVDPDRDNLSYEAVEFANGIDKMLEERRNTLESRAYGVRYGGRMGTNGGWTVVFRYKKSGVDTPKAKVKGLGVDWSLFEKSGRAVTMDADFGNLRVEHKGFWLDKVDKKL